MLKNRQEGLISLHGFFVGVILCLLYWLWAALVERVHWIRFAEHTNIDLYFIGVIVGTLISLRSYRYVSGRLGHLSWLELLSLTQRQLVRIALVLLALAFATKDATISRGFLGSYLIAAGVVLSLLNCFLPSVLSRIFFNEKNVRTLFIGSADEVLRLRGWAAHKSGLGLEPVGYLCDEQGTPAIAGLPFLGRTDDCERVLVERGIRQIVMLQFYLDRERSSSVVHAAQRTGVRLHFFNNFNAYYDRPIAVDHQGEFTFFTLDEEPLENPVNRLLKRMLDVAISLPVVIFILPSLTLAVAFVQRFQSPGPIFFPQVRSGINKRRFRILKYRTMHSSFASKEQERVQAKSADPRVYPFGRFLRRTSLDELPQFINVLLGEMSVAGPRPHMIEHDDAFAKILRTYYSRHYVKPGITGLAQSKGCRGEVLATSALQQRVAYDLQYISSWTMALDVRIVLTTIRQVLFPPKTAY